MTADSSFNIKQSAVIDPLLQKGSHELFLEPLHFGGAGGCLVIKTAEMKKPVRDVETELVLERGAERARLAPRRFRANHDFAMLKRDDVRGARFIEKASMQVGHAPVGNQNDAHFTQFL